MICKLLIFTFVLALTGCFQSNESKIKSRLSDLADHMSYSKPIPPIQLAIKANKISKFFSKQMNLQIKVKGANFALTKNRQLEQHIFSLRKMMKVFNLKFNNIEIRKGGMGYLVKTLFL